MRALLAGWSVMATRIRIQPGDGDSRHGTTSGYCNHGCRCPECVAVWTAYHADWRARLRAALAADPNHPRHGRSVSYTAGCRCERCTTAKRAVTRSYQRRRLIDQAVRAGAR